MTEELGLNFGNGNQADDRNRIDDKNKNINNLANQGGQAGVTMHASEGGQVSGKGGTNVSQGGQIAHEYAQNANQMGQNAKKDGKNDFTDGVIVTGAEDEGDDYLASEEQSEEVHEKAEE